MLSTKISQTEKAMEYAEQPDRFQFLSFSICIAGNHRMHRVDFCLGKWSCDCERFTSSGDCVHIHSAWLLLCRKARALLVGAPTPPDSTNLNSDGNNMMRRSDILPANLYKVLQVLTTSNFL